MTGLLETVCLPNKDSPETAVCRRIGAWDGRPGGPDLNTPGAGPSGEANVGVELLREGKWQAKRPELSVQL